MLIYFGSFVFVRYMDKESVIAALLQYADKYKAQVAFPSHLRERSRDRRGKNKDYGRARSQDRRRGGDGQEDQRDQNPHEERGRQRNRGRRENTGDHTSRDRKARTETGKRQQQVKIEPAMTGVLDDQQMHRYVVVIMDHMYSCIMVYYLYV